ncbi:MAG: ribonuclease HII [Croceivirga sp.]
MKRGLLLIFVLVLACTQEQKTADLDLYMLPPNASLIVKINQPTAYQSELKNNIFLQKVQTTSLLKSFVDKTRLVDFELLGQNALLAFYPLGRDNHEFLFVQKSDSIPISLEESSNKTVETLNYQNRQITHVQIEGKELFSANLNQRLLVSSSQLLLENVIRKDGKHTISPTLEKLIQTADISKPASFFFSLTNKDLFANDLSTSENEGITQFADWISVDFSANQDELLFSGVAVTQDSLPKFIDLFKGTVPLSDKTAGLAPQNADGVLSFSFNDFDLFKRNQKRFLDVVSLRNDAISNIEEIGVIFLNGQKALAIHAYENEAFTGFIEKVKGNSSNYQGTDIWQLNENGFGNQFFSPLVKDAETRFYSVFEDAHLFAKNEDILKTIIAAKRSGVTFDKGAVYKSVKAQLGTESSLLFISSTEGIGAFLGKHFSSQLTEEFDRLGLPEMGFGTQLITDAGFSHFNVLATEIKKAPQGKAVMPLYNLELDSDLVTDPQFVKNHRNNTYEIVVQDQDHNLYLISPKGKVLWKKQLEGSIRGKIHQVDLYKNGKLQLAFCTNNQFLILDRNGDEVAPFNKIYEGGNLNALAVFDYENNRNYRFVVTQGKKVFMYNSQGNIVDGFTYTETESPVISAPKHFKINKKDYLAFQLENGQLKIRHRAGGSRVKVDRTISFTNNEVFLYKNRFSVTDKKGVLHQVDTKGQLSATNFNLSENHGMYATSKSLVLMDDNVLNIKGKKVELEFGVYSPPKIFYINDKIYVAVTDIQNQQIYLFDSQAKGISNFPVYGSSIIDLFDINRDNKLELVAKDQENSIIVYTLN